MTTGPTHATRESAPEAARPAEQEAAVPAAPVPLAVGTLTVGHAEDRAEADADRMADSALARLRGGGDSHTHGPGCDHLRREVAPSLGVLRREVPEAPPLEAAAPAPAYQRGPAREPVGVIPDRATLDGAPGAESRLVRPTTMDELIGCRDLDINALVHDTKTGGPLRDVLLGAFEGDWFRAKSCLVFGRWPKSPKRFTDEAALRLMSALTVYRGEVHKAVMAEAKKAVAQELADTAARLPGNQSLAAGLVADTGIAPEKQVEYKGSVGADTVTSDVDVSTGGINSEIAVRCYNEQFRRYMKVPLDPGTVFDLNVYAKDFIHGFTDSGDLTRITPKRENDSEASALPAAAQDDRDREQDIWALVHVARYMPADADWDAYVAKSVTGLADAKVPDQLERLATARRRAQGFEYRLLSMMEQLGKTLDLGLGKASSWQPADNEHFQEGAVRMRAANKLYEDKLLQVKELRLKIDQMRLMPPQAAPPNREELLGQLVARLDGELSMAQLYANEVYGSGGATVHAVMGMQMPKKLTKERGFTVRANLPKQQLYASFTDNLGDVLKDYEHYGKAEHGATPDYWYAAFKMGKYANRVVDTLRGLADGSADDVLTPTDHVRLVASPEFRLLDELATQHLAEKDGAGGSNPVTLQHHPYFGAMDAVRVAGLRAAAIDLGASVRRAAASKGPAAEVPDRPVRAADITTEQIERARADVAAALARVRTHGVEAAGPDVPRGRRSY